MSPDALRARGDRRAKPGNFPVISGLRPESRAGRAGPEARKDPGRTEEERAHRGGDRRLLRGAPWRDVRGHVALSDAAVVYQGLANGDIDIYPSAWPEETHIEYAERYEDDYESQGSYYENADLNLSVPEYVDIDSIPELRGQADRFGGRIVGIEPGAGLTRATQDDVIPGYDLEGYELTTSSTTAMLAELDTAIQNEEDIVVTLWTPFRANGTFPVKALEDPEGLFPEPESLHFLARAGFSEDYPELADYIGDIDIDDEEYSVLEDLVVNEYGEGNEPEAIQAWLELYPDLLPPLPQNAEE